MKEEEICNTGLSLGLRQAEFVPRGDKQPQVQFHILFPSNPKEEIIKEEDDADRRLSLKRIDHEDEEQAANKNNDDTSDDNNSSKNSTRKKLRLTKEQSTLLEDSFKEHTTLTLTQKQELADHLNLKPRQVEVWFQNRRARTKLKQTEVDCEYMKKYCERISEENRRLKKEVQELRSMKLRWSSSSSLSPLYIQVQSMCPSCERITTMTGDNNGKNTGGGVPDNKLYSGGKDDSSLTC